MEQLTEIINNWYLVLFLISAGVALVVWIRASKRKARLDIDQATELILKRRYRNGQISKEKYERRLQFLSGSNPNSHR